MYGWSNIRVSQWVCIESSWTRSLGSEICSVGQIWTSIWMMWHQKASVSICKMFNIKYYLFRKMFCQPNVDHSLYWSNFRWSQWICIESSLLRTNLLEICLLGQICNTLWLTYHQKESIVIYKKFKIEYSFTRNMSIKSNMQYSMADVSSEAVNL